MRRSIFMYLFFFAALLVVFQYMNEKKIFRSQGEKISRLEKKLNAATDSLNSINGSQNTADSYFGLERNENAYAYFDKFNVPVTGLKEKIEDAVINKNSSKGNDLIPFENDRGIYKINKILVLNHKWILADFTNGERWGELLLGYSINEAGGIDFEILESLIYPVY